MRNAFAVGLLFALLAAGADRSSLPEKVVSARSVYIQNDSGDSKLGGELNKALKRWGRWQMVNNRAEADLIAVLDHKHTFIQNNFTLTLLDAKSSEPVWSAKHGASLNAQRVIAHGLISELRDQLPGRPGKP